MIKNSIENFDIGKSKDLNKLSEEIKLFIEHEQEINEESLYNSKNIEKNIIEARKHLSNTRNNVKIMVENIRSRGYNKNDIINSKNNPSYCKTSNRNR